MLYRTIKLFSTSIVESIHRAPDMNIRRHDRVNGAALSTFP
jgi:hypothetical protein